jgi:hypothetical protein
VDIHTLVHRTVEDEGVEGVFEVVLERIKAD